MKADFGDLQIDILKPNFSLTMGDDKGDFSFNFRVKRSIRNRLKYWLFCKFFPFKITRWDDLRRKGNESI